VKFCFGSDFLWNKWGYFRQFVDVLLLKVYWCLFWDFLAGAYSEGGYGVWATYPSQFYSALKLIKHFFMSWKHCDYRIYCTTPFRLTDYSEIIYSWYRCLLYSSYSWKFCTLQGHKYVKRPDVPCNVPRSLASCSKILWSLAVHKGSLFRGRGSEIV